MKALIAMSGGVDSSVAAKLMLEEGAECCGCTMKLYDNADAGISAGHTCCSLDDIEDARAVCYRLGIPHRVFNFKDEFQEKVIKKFARAYVAGLTPNPCIDCNQYLKFDLLLRRGEILGYDCVVTGHYARIEREGDRFFLKKALDDAKDQSYFLYRLTQRELRRIRFPLGSLHKREVRELAEAGGFINAEKHDSQDICFAPDGDYAAAVERCLGVQSRRGAFVDSNGKHLGIHRGIIHYTVGQRRGLGVSAGQPLYVLKIRPEENQIVLGTRDELYTKYAEVNDLSWVLGAAPAEEFRCKVKLRSRQTERDATVHLTGNGGARIVFDAPQRAGAAGQAAVFYDGDTVLGGGILGQSGGLSK